MNGPTPLDEVTFEDNIHLKNFINGEFVEPQNAKYLESFNPATGSVINLVPDSDERDINAAVEAAKKV